MGRDALADYPADVVILFQPTRPHGARRALACSSVVARMFQPTRPHGARRQIIASV